MSEDTLYDLLVTCEDPSRKVAPRGGESLLRYLAVTRLVQPSEEAVADTWSEVYCAAGPSAHEAFVEGAWEGDRAPFLEAAIRFGTRPTPIPFGMDEQEVTFYVCFQGCLFRDVSGRFKKKFKDILYTRPRMFVREHAGIAPHLVVPEDELPKDRRRKRDTLGTSAGTRVEEW